jgi:hypothetical protein
MLVHVTLDGTEYEENECVKTLNSTDPQQKNTTYLMLYQRILEECGKPEAMRTESKSLARYNQGIPMSKGGCEMFKCKKRSPQ